MLKSFCLLAFYAALFMAGCLPLSAYAQAPAPALPDQVEYVNGMQEPVFVLGYRQRVAVVARYNQQGKLRKHFIRLHRIKAIKLNFYSLPSQDRLGLRLAMRQQQLDTSGRFAEQPLVTSVGGVARPQATLDPLLARLAADNPHNGVQLYGMAGVGGRSAALPSEFIVQNSQGAIDNPRQVSGMVFQTGVRVIKNGVIFGLAYDAMAIRSSDLAKGTYNRADLRFLGPELGLQAVTPYANGHFTVAFGPQYLQEAWRGPKVVTADFASTQAALRLGAGVQFKLLPWAGASFQASHLFSTRPSAEIPEVRLSRTTFCLGVFMLLHRQGGVKT